MVPYHPDQKKLFPDHANTCPAVGIETAPLSSQPGRPRRRRGRHYTSVDVVFIFRYTASGGIFWVMFR